MFFGCFCESGDKTVLEADREELNKGLIEIADYVIPLRKPLLNAKERYILMNEGRGTGKSDFMTSFLLYKSMSLDYKDKVFLCIREYLNSIDDSVYTDLERQIYLLGLDHMFKFTKKNIVNKITGVKFVFKGLQKVYSIKSINEVAIISVEEAGQVSLKNLDIVMPVLRGVSPDLAKVVFAMNRFKAKEDVEAFLDRQPENQVIETSYWIKDLPIEYQNPILLDQMEADFEMDVDLALWKWKNHPHPDQGNEPFRNIALINNPSDVDYTKTGRAVAFIDPSFMGGDYTAMSIVYNYESEIYVHGYSFKQAHDSATAKIANIIKNFPTKVSVFYESNSIGYAPMKNLGELDIVAKPIKQTRNKALRIAEISGNKSLMRKLKFVNQKENLLYNKEFMNYNAEACRTNKQGFYDDPPDSLEGALKILQRGDFATMDL